ncbi:2-amino-4-hydroxy-6-hydroxymethyldihydropteridine diphosphokinase [Azospirillum agricola]|uniref:2-amino-4-hydroxy-6- hydroxymethyldihydropteridine diphosphokinase n=1 Tax=Azospirillum agricola TaxID=1720247 RepID=UPI001AE887CC|nr:2-amino-4-hydroxy-6-hydroxymethyldihydropteridine diphosphokinase [Azospirillum agricola]MBP2231572.1 2-amino-4-hydroxy-6-hydroxymethyldihydropteridine diphosphokinase [Azospirillum agricola]
MTATSPATKAPSPPGATVHLALGGNIGDRAANLAAAIQHLGEAVAIDRLSAVYQTAPMYVTDQPAFLNMAVRGVTRLAPLELLRFVKRIEADLGRTGGGERFGPRPIDIDILFYGDLDGNRTMAGPELEIPHPRIAERAFVLAPLADIAADLSHPTLGRPVAELLAAVPGRDTVVRVADALDAG